MFQLVALTRDKCFQRLVLLRGLLFMSNVCTHVYVQYFRSFFVSLQRARLCK